MRQWIIAAWTAIGFIICFPAMAERETRTVKILLPLEKEQVSEIRLGDWKCRIVSIQSSKTVPSILVLKGGYRQHERDEEDDFYSEFRYFLKKLKEDGLVPPEVWSTEGWGRYLISAPFGSHQVSVLRHLPGRPYYSGSNPVFLPEDVVRLVARRFAGRGPVRMFVLGSFNVDGRGMEPYESGGYMTTRIEPFWDHVGDSGIVVYPVIVPPRKVRPSSPKIKKSFSTQLFGTNELIAGGEPGAALLEAYRRAQREIVVEIEVPRQYYTFLRGAQKLRVFSADGVKSFERPFIAGGAPVDEAEAIAEMQSSLSRVVEPLFVRAADITPRCSGIESPSEKSLFLHLAGVDFPAAQPESSPVLLTSHARDVLIERGAKAMLIRNGKNACAGPLPTVFDRTVFVYDPARLWLGIVEVQWPR